MMFNEPKPKGEKIPFLGYEERILSQIHGVKGDGVGLRAKIEHRLVMPTSPPNTNQHIVVFYYDYDVFSSLKRSAKTTFGDNDFSKSVSRYLRAGFHYMGKSEDIDLVTDCIGRKARIKLEIEHLELNLNAHRGALKTFQDALENETPSKELIKALWSRLISKLVPNWMSRK